MFYGLSVFKKIVSCDMGKVDTSNEVYSVVYPLRIGIWYDIMIKSFDLGKGGVFMQLQCRSRMAPLFKACLCLAVCLALVPGTARAATASAVGQPVNVSVIYGVLFALSFLLLLGYCFLVKKKSVWFVLLYISVFVVNGGYLGGSLAQDLQGALLANQVSYFGAAMLPLAMLMIIINTCRIDHPRWLTAVFVLVSFSAFLLAASGGYSTLYYKEVFIEEINGICCLRKVYGPLHFLYTGYLFSYFGLMIAAIVYAGVRKKISSCKYVIFLASAVGGNLIIWFVEQLVHVNFEFLSVSYIATELLMLSVHGIMQDYSSQFAKAQAVFDDQLSKSAVTSLPPDVEELFRLFSEHAAALTATERSILRYYADGKEINEVAELACISIHTVRKHNANIYQKLSVGSRDELMLYLDLFRRSGRVNEILEPRENPTQEILAG